MTDQTKNITVAIEAAVLGGSLALSNNSGVIDTWIGTEGVSRSEDLLLAISEVLRLHSVDKSDIRVVAVSTGPGSYTGIRVGIATALGLKNALGVSCIGVQVLEAMRASVNNRHKRVMAAIPIGRNDLCWQFTGENIQIGKLEELVTVLAADPEVQAVVHSKVLTRMFDEGVKYVGQVVDGGSDLARHIGFAAAGRDMDSGLDPVYIRDFV